MSTLPDAYIVHREHCGDCQGCDFTNEIYARCSEGRRLIAEGDKRELEQYRLAVPQLVEDIAALQRTEAQLVKERDAALTQAEFWKQACKRALQLAGMEAE